LVTDWVILYCTCTCVY